MSPEAWQTLADDLARIFLGWKLREDYDALLAIGEGSLRIGGKTVDYYNIASASFGLQIGAQQYSIVMVFMNDEALMKFRDSKGWDAGVDGSVAVAEWGAGDDINTKTFKDPIVAFVFGNKGLMAGVSIEGSKITKIEK